MALHSGAFCFHGFPTVAHESLRHRQWVVKSSGFLRSRVVSKSHLKVKGKLHSNGLLDLICFGFCFVVIFFSCDFKLRLGVLLICEVNLLEFSVEYH